MNFDQQYIEENNPDFNQQFVEENNHYFDKQFIEEQRGAMLIITGNDSSLIKLEDIRNNTVGTSLIYLNT